MHELSICQGLFKQLETIAADNQAEQIDRVHLHIGALAGVEIPLLKQAFNVIRAGTIAAQADLVIHPTPIQIQCNQCGKTSDADINRLVCTHCGDWHTRLISGDELLLANVEMTTAATHNNEQPGNRSAAHV